MEDCTNFTNTPITQEEDPCKGCKTDSNCVIEGTALTELGLSADSTQKEVNIALQNVFLALSNNQTETDDNLDKNIKVDLTSEQIKILSSQPLQLVGAQGIGKIIEVKDAFYTLKYNTDQYTSTKLMLTGAYEMEVLGLDEDSSLMKYFRKVNDVSSNSDLRENEALNIKSDVDSVLGDSSISIYITYKVKEL